MASATNRKHQQQQQQKRFSGLAVDGGMPPSEFDDIYTMHDALVERTYPIIRGFISGRIPPWSFADRLRDVGVPECIFATHDFQTLLQRELEVDSLPFNEVRLVIKGLINQYRLGRYRARHGDRLDDRIDEGTSTDGILNSRVKPQQQRPPRLEDSGVQTDDRDEDAVHHGRHECRLSPAQRCEYLPLDERRLFLRGDIQKETSSSPSPPAAAAAVSGGYETWSQSRAQRIRDEGTAAARDMRRDGGVDVIY